MATINIGADNAGDQFYRYKMPAIQAKIEGRGNGIKTNVVNMVDVAKALARPPTHTLKYFGCELGAQTKFDSKSGGQCIVNGRAHRGDAGEPSRGIHQALRAVPLVRQPGDGDQHQQTGDDPLEVQGVRRGVGRGHAAQALHVHPQEPPREGQSREQEGQAAAAR